jgi:hypothetical protein
MSNSDRWQGGGSRWTRPTDRIDTYLTYLHEEFLFGIVQILPERECVV